MSRLLDPAEFDHTAALIYREARALIDVAAAVREQLDKATAGDDPQGMHIYTGRLAAIARQLTRAQAVLVHASDARYAAAQAVLGYCDEADRRSPWQEPAAPLKIGIAETEAA